jgi:hypothetical protein
MPTKPSNGGQCRATLRLQTFANYAAQPLFINQFLQYLFDEIKKCFIQKISFISKIC